MNLTKEDIKTIFEALDALPEVKKQSNALSGIFGTIFLKDDVEARAKFEEERRKEKEKLEEEQAVLAEKIVLIKAKLIQIKDQMIISEITQ